MINYITNKILNSGYGMVVIINDVVNKTNNISHPSYDNYNQQQNRIKKTMKPSPRKEQSFHVPNDYVSKQKQEGVTDKHTQHMKVPVNLAYNKIYILITFVIN